MSSSRRCVAAVLLACFVMPWAAAEKGDLNLDIKVNHGAAYRDGSWAPVDVYVHNESRDISGALEVRLYNAMGDMLSPVYRIAAESPNPSNKRFRVHCKMTGVDRIEAQLYHGWRGVNPMAWLRVRPIRDTDYLCLVLDDEPEDYVFLSTALFPGDREVRFHREALTSRELGALADYPQCFEAFDLIVLGRVDPANIAESHRALLREYVATGGTLVVCLGEGGAAYRGSWLEDLLGTDIGASEVTNGYELATRVFGEVEMAPEHRQRQGVYTRLTPARDDVEAIGDAITLATIRTVGRGSAVAIAVDAGSGLLHAEKQYHALWRDLSTRATRMPELNLDGMATLCAMNLPRLAGVTLFPVSSVITYLVLYFVVAIVLNWIFWSILKRREMAWLCLVFFSLGFTGYAMFFGTRGRAKSTEVEHVEVLQLPAGSETARSTVLAGVLAAGSGRFSGDLVRPYSLVDDLSDNAMVSQYDPYGRHRQGRTRPFEFVQDEPGRVEDFRIGASEMRLITVESYVPIDGPIEGSFTLDGNRIECEVVDNTGLNLLEVHLLHFGRLYRLRLEEGTWRISTHVESGVAPDPQQQISGFYRESGSVSDFRRAFRNTVLAQDAGGVNNPMMMGGPQPPGSELAASYASRWQQGLATGSYLVAWANQPAGGVLDMDQEAKEKISVTMMIAEVPLKDKREEATGPVALSCRSTPGQQTASRSAGKELSVALSEHAPAHMVQIEVPEWLGKGENATHDVLVDVTYRLGTYIDRGRGIGDVLNNPDQGGLISLGGADAEPKVEFVLLKGNEQATLEPESRNVAPSGDFMVTTSTYRLRDWGRVGHAPLLLSQLRLDGPGANAPQMNYYPQGYYENNSMIAIASIAARAVPRNAPATEGVL